MCFFVACMVVGAVTTFAYAADIPFMDMDRNAWYYDAVVYVYQNNIMNGVSNTAFDAEAKVSRAQMCQTLFNIEDVYSIGSSSFSDVRPGAWYYDAITWAADNGIVKGMGNGTFSPNTPITREQMVVMLYRYAQYKGHNISINTVLRQYTDAKRLYDSKYAFAWAIGEGYITGTSNTTLSPYESATRGQMAAILMRFCENWGGSYPFNGSYWSLTFGQSLGGLYLAKFYTDGTFIAHSFNSKEEIYNGTYYYDGNDLYITLSNLCRDEKFSKDKWGYTSEKKHEMQVGYDNYRMSPVIGDEF